MDTKKRRAKLLTEEGVTRLIEATTRTRIGTRSPGTRFPGTRDRALLELLYGSALRVSEAVGLKVPQLDLVQATATVLGKGARWRTVPLTPPAVRALQALLTWRREGPVFRTVDERPMGTRLARKVVEHYAKLARLPHSSPHTLRHSCASHMLKNGAYLFTVQDLLGHQHPGTTAVYLHRMPVLKDAQTDYRTSHPRAGP